MFSDSEEDDLTQFVSPGDGVKESCEGLVCLSLKIGVILLGSASG